MKTTRFTTTLFGTLAVALLFATFVLSAGVAQPAVHVMENVGAAK